MSDGLLVSDFFDSREMDAKAEFSFRLFEVPSFGSPSERVVMFEAFKRVHGLGGRSRFKGRLFKASGGNLGSQVSDFVKRKARQEKRSRQIANT